MSVDAKLTFHILLVTEIDGNLVATAYQDFKNTLIQKFSSKCDCKLQIDMIKVYQWGRWLGEELMVVYCNSEDTTKLMDIFLHLVCDFYSDLIQEEYCYETGDTLVNIRLGDD